MIGGSISQALTALVEFGKKGLDCTVEGRKRGLCSSSDWLQREREIALKMKTFCIDLNHYALQLPRRGSRCFLALLPWNLQTGFMRNIYLVTSSQSF